MAEAKKTVLENMADAKKTILEFADYT